MDYGEEHTRNIAIDLNYERHRYVYRSVKRIFDFVASFFGLVLLLPVFLIVAIAIKLEEPKGASILFADSFRTTTAPL